MISQRQARRAVELHSTELSAYPNVVGMGVRRIGRPELPASQQDHAVAVYVTEKRSVDELGPDAVLPTYVEIPGRGSVHQVAIEVVEIGEVDRERSEQSEDRGPSAFSAE